MECACIDMSDYDGDLVEFHHSKVVHARKEHKCNECHRKINNEKYEIAVMKFEGKFDKHRTCLDCLSMRDAFFCNWLYGTIWDDLINEFHEDEHGFKYTAIEELTPRARDTLCDIIEEYWHQNYDEDDE